MSVPVVLPAPTTDERALARREERFYFASQRQLIWWRLRKHRLAMGAFWVLLGLYASIPFVEFLSPYALHARHPDYVYGPPQRIHLFHEGRFVGPFVYGTLMAINLENLKREYREDTTQLYRVKLLVGGEPYRLWGLWPSERHLFGVEEGGTLFLLGTDRLGRDMLSRIIHGARISLTVGLIGISVSFVLALIFGDCRATTGGSSTWRSSGSSRSSGPSRSSRSGWRSRPPCRRAGTPSWSTWASP